MLDDEARKNTNTNSGKVNELLTSFSHLLSTFKVRPTYVWNFYNEKVTSDKPLYWINSNIVFSQAVLSAPDVFNFYDANYAPNDSSFSSHNLIAPELQIQTSRNLIRYSNLIQTIFFNDKYHTINIDSQYENMDDFMSQTLSSKSNAADTHIYVDLSDVYEAFKNALDGSFSNLNNADKLNIGLIALVDYLDNKMLGLILPNDYKIKLIEELKTITSYEGNLPNRARDMVVTSIRAIATSPYYMIIK